jgi:hypothetical protein
MPDKVTSSGTNSQGNHYCNRQSDSGGRGYHYSKYVAAFWALTLTRPHILLPIVTVS